MTLRPTELVQVAAEIAERLAERTVQKVVAVGEETIALGFPRAWLLISIDRHLGRVHLLAHKPPGTGEAAPAFVMLLRKELVGLRLAAVEPVDGQRALSLELARGPLRRRLLVFLFGSGPRLVLLDPHTPIAAFPAPRRGQPIPVELPAPRADDRPSRFSGPEVSAAIAALYQQEDDVRRATAMRARTAVELRRLRDKLRRKEEALASDLERLQGAAGRRRHADLLLAHLAEVPRGASVVTLPDDFSAGEPTLIPLDPARSASENAAAIYRLLRRLERGRPLLQARLEQTRSERLRAEDQLAAVEAGDPAAIAGLTIAGGTHASGRSPEATAPRRRGPARAPAYRQFRSASGTPILVGRGAARNDELTFRVARGNDLWLHARDSPGAHVVVALAGASIDEGTLLDAATLAAWFSPARPTAPAVQPVQVDVTYAPRKLVRKPKGAAPGRVSVAGGKTIRVRLEADRLERLLASSPTSDEARKRED